MWARHRTILLALTALVAVGIAVVLAVWSGTDESPTDSTSAKVQLRLGYRPRVLADATPPVLNEFIAGGAAVDVELVSVSTPQDGLVKLRSGEIDALAGLPLEVVFQQLTGDAPPPFVAYAFSVDVAGDGWVSIIARQGSGVSSLAEAGGHTMAVTPTPQGEYLGREILKAAGVPEDQIRITTFNPQNPLIGFRAGEHDLLLIAEPAISMLEAEGHQVVAAGPVSTYVFDGQPVPLTASVISREFVERHPEATEAFIGAVLNAAKFIRESPDKARPLFGQEVYGGLSEDLRARFRFSVIAPADEAIRPSVELFARRLERDGVLSHPINVGPLFRPFKAFDRSDDPGRADGP